MGTVRGTVGCKRDREGDREYTIELNLADGIRRPRAGEEGRGTQKGFDSHMNLFFNDRSKNETVIKTFALRPTRSPLPEPGE